MGKRRNLNGLPNSLTQQFFSDMFYQGKGYMSDWIWYLALEHGVNEVKFDILELKADPLAFQVKPILRWFPTLQETISRTLASNGFESDFISSAYIEVFISYKFRHQKLLTGQATIIDQDGNSIQGKTYTEKAYSKPYDKIPQSISPESLSDSAHTRPKSWWNFWK